MKTTLVIQSCLQRLKSGDHHARDELVSKFSSRLKELVRRMVLARQWIAPGIQLDHLIEQSVARLRTNFGHSTPTSVHEFFELGTAHLRRELANLAEACFDPPDTDLVLQENATKISTAPDLNETGPATLRETGDMWAQWQHFHEASDKLCDHEKRIFELLWYHGLTLAEAAEVLGMNERVVKKSWNAARIALKSNMIKTV